MNGINQSRRPTKFLVVCFSLIVISAFSSISLAQIQGSVINGMVFDPFRKGITDVDVELLDEYSRLIFRTRTTSGRFTFRGLVAGVYRVRVIPQRLGYDEQTQEVQIINLARSSQTGPSNDSVFIDFYLQQIKTPSLAESMGVASVVFVQEVPESARRTYEDAVSELTKNNADAGIARLKKALDFFPTYFLALSRLGEEMIRRQEFQTAEQLMQKALAVNSKDAGSYYLLGYSQFVQKKFDSAVISLQQATRWSSKSATAFLFLGMALRRTGKFSEAEAQMLKAKDLSKKKLPDVHWQLALLYGNELKKYAEAANELELFLKAQPDSKDAESIKKLIKQFRDKAVQARN